MVFQSTEGMLYVNRCTWAHILSEAAKLAGIDATELLSKDEIAALNGKANPGVGIYENSGGVKQNKV